MWRRIGAWFQTAARYRIEKWVWIVFTPVAIITGLVNQVAVVSLLSIYALALSAAAAEQAAEAKEQNRDDE